MTKILSRIEWKQKIFERDQNTCVLCNAQDITLDVHHLIERKLFSDGGYYIDNGVSLCAEKQMSNQFSCHMKAEGCIILPNQLRTLANITNTVLPEGWDNQKEYDKWGNIVVSEQSRKPGRIFDNEEVQKVLKTCNTLWMYHAI